MSDLTDNGESCMALYTQRQIHNHFKRDLGEATTTLLQAVDLFDGKNTDLKRMKEVLDELSRLSLALENILTYFEGYREV